MRKNKQGRETLLVLAHLAVEYQYLAHGIPGSEPFCTLRV